MKKKRLVLVVVLMSIVLMSNAMTIKRVLQGDELNRLVVKEQAMYIIEGDCSLSGNVTLAAGSILKFEGGKIAGTGNIVDVQLMIDAPKYQIFGENISVSGIANGEVSAHWWGAKGDGVNYDCSAINRALRDASTSWVVLENLKYLTKTAIVLNQLGQKLRCAGSILYQGANAAIDLKVSYVDLKINKLQGTNKKGSGVLFSGSVYNSNIDVNIVDGFRYGLNFTPINSGVQYCKISWQSINCNTGIYIDLWDSNNSKAVWVNENQFNGGRLHCNYGIVVAEKRTGLKSYDADVINGNVFNSIGFEGWDNVKIKPITLRHAWFNEFHDLRMSEGLVVDKNIPLIELENCGYNTIGIKSAVPYSRIKATNCNNIELQGAFSDSGAGIHKGYDRMYIVCSDSKYTTPINTKEKGASVKTFKLLSSRIQSRNILNKIYLGRTQNVVASKQTKTLNFNELFTTPHDDKGVIILSDVVEISVYDSSTLTIDVTNSIANSCPEVEMRCNIGGGSKVRFVNGKTEISTIAISGNYRITFDEARNLKIVKMAE